MLRFLLAAGTGAALTYFLDPDRGKRRRAIARDKMGALMRDMAGTASGKAEYASDRAKGMAHEARSKVGETTASARESVSSLTDKARENVSSLTDKARESISSLTGKAEESTSTMAGGITRDTYSDTSMAGSDRLDIAGTQEAWSPGASGMAEPMDQGSSFHTHDQPSPPV